MNTVAFLRIHIDGKNSHTNIFTDAKKPFIKILVRELLPSKEILPANRRIDRLWAAITATKQDAFVVFARSYRAAH